MIYNIHPILVHFPIAFLSLYSAIVLLPIQKWFPKIKLKTTQDILLLVGTLGIFLAKASGEIAVEITKLEHSLVEMHELFANATTWFYMILVIIFLLPYVIYFLQKKNLKFPKFIQLLKKLSTFLNKKNFIKVSALLGVVSLFITGLLGGVIVYGVDADPIASFVLKLLGL